MEMAERPNLQTMLKAAMLATSEQINVNDEAARQLAHHQGEVKVASAEDELPDHYTSEHIEKMASALDYVADQIKVADDGNVQQPGKGPNSLDVLESNNTSDNIDAGEGGHAIAKNLPKPPAEQKEEVQVGKANTGMSTNDAAAHPEQPVSPIKNENASIAPASPLPAPTTQTKAASVEELAASNLERIAKMGSAPETREIVSDVPVELIRKIAEDGLSPSKIEAGKQNAPDASASGESVPKQPSDVTSQARSMLGSNMAAIDYKKQQAKADPKSDVNQVLAQPALTRTGDSTLHKVLANTNKAGVKFASIQDDSVKTAAARALLTKLVDKVAAEKKKEKDSMMGAAPTSPSSASGFTASSLN